MSYTVVSQGNTTCGLMFGAVCCIAGLDFVACVGS